MANLPSRRARGRREARKPPLLAQQVAERLFHFFSSRRRHPRCLSDWSSDVCSSDLDFSPGLAGGQVMPWSAFFVYFFIQWWAKKYSDRGGKHIRRRIWVGELAQR